jgi:glycosyltransferase involved in cell wall biosynthesis
MAACDVILAPAIDEPLARNVLEALALEVPVVVSTDGGLRELIGGANGLLCDPYDTPAWVAATRRVLDNPLFARSLAANGRATVAELTPERHARRITAIYRGLHGQIEKVA